jgi:hypothetical protein
MYEEFPKSSIRAKRGSRLMRAIDLVLKIITFGQQRSFMTAFVTTVGVTVYVPDSWESRPSTNKAITLLHELVHMRQRRKYGVLLFPLLYLFVPLPTVFALCRRNFEREAYEESMLAQAQTWGIGAVEDAKYKEDIISQFVGPSYFWAYPFRASMEKWYAGALERIRHRL